MVAANHQPAVSRRAPKAGARPGLRSRGVRVGLVLVAPLAIAFGLLSAKAAFELGSWFLADVLVIGFVVVAAMLVIGLRDLRVAEARTDAALDRAASAETVQRARADELARVLEASEGLVLKGEGQVDYLGILSAITPEGATSLLVRIENVSESVVFAAHGPLAASVVGLRRSMADEASGFDGTQPATFSASGRPVGLEILGELFAGLESEIEASLTVGLTDQNGQRIGLLHMIDPIEERVIEPTFVSLAQLVANQIAMAMENNALMAGLRHELVEGQRVQQQLAQASKLGAVGELAAAVAHEVNNPLTGILGFAELLLSELPADDPRHDEAAVIRDEAVRARTIVKALLEFARPRAPQRIPTSLNDLARSSLELVRFRALEADVAIVADYGDVPILELDPDALKQVLLNVFNNAIDAMPQGGTLHVSTEQVADRGCVVVSDTGIGMDEETQGRIFTPFFSTRAANGGRTGLGLSVSRQIVEGHGGTIEVESTPGRGAVFTVGLPSSWAAFEGAIQVPEMDPASATPAGAGSGGGPSTTATRVAPRDSDSAPAAGEMGRQAAA